MNLPDFMLDGAAQPTMELVAPPPPPPHVPGYHPDMHAATYHAIEAMSASGARKMLRSPAHYKLMRTTANEPTDAMQLGTAIHAGWLEPDTFDAAIVAAPEVNRRTKDGKAEWDAFQKAHAGKVILSPDAMKIARACVASLQVHPAATALRVGAEVEGSMCWIDGRYLVPCKARFDLRNHGGLIDLKTTQDASPEAFGRSVASWGYHVQAAHYFSGSEHVLDVTPEFFAFVVVETEPPHLVACYVVPSAAILAGAHLMNRALERYAIALESGNWLGYPDTIETLQFPKWALRFDN